MAGVIKIELVVYTNSIVMETKSAVAPQIATKISTVLIWKATYLEANKTSILNISKLMRCLPSKC